MARIRSFDPLRMAARAAVDLSAETGMMVAVLVWGTFGPTVVQVQEGTDQAPCQRARRHVFTLSGTATGGVFAGFMQGKAVRDVLKAEMREGARTQRIGTPVSAAEMERASRQCAGRLLHHRGPAGAGRQRDSRPRCSIRAVSCNRR